MLDDLKTCRATTFLGASWIVVFLAMHVAQLLGLTQAPPREAQALGFGQVSVETAHVFGALRWTDLQAGQGWRLVTATFVHYSALHLLMNLIGLMQLGWLMEPWYGSRQFLAINLALGGLGNLLGGVMRQGFYHLRATIEAAGIGRLLPDFLRNGAGPAQAFPVTTGGGSTIILGLIGMAMVVGWRSRTRVGEFLRDQMLAFLGYTALIGAVLAKIVDNYGHAGGAFVGIALGFLHRKMVRTAPNGRIRTFVGIAESLVLLLCIGLQARVGMDESSRHREAVKARSELEVTARRSQSAEVFLNRLKVLGQVLDQTARLQLWRVPNLKIKPADTDPLIDWPEDLPMLSGYDSREMQELFQQRRLIRQLLTNVVTSFDEVRKVLDADLVDEPFERLLAIARNATSKTPSTKELLEFEILSRELGKKTTKRLEDLSSRAARLSATIEAGTRRP